jgi:chemotaxis signal transduction protein
MCSLRQLIVFIINEQKCSVDFFIVEGSFPVVEIFPVPKTPDFFSDIINLQGQYIPALDTRKLLNLPPKDNGPNEQLFISRWMSLVSKGWSVS